MNRSTPGLPVHHQLPEFTQTHVHRVSDAIQPVMPSSHLILCRPLLLLPPVPPSIRVFSNKCKLNVHIGYQSRNQHSAPAAPPCAGTALASLAAPGHMCLFTYKHPEFEFKLRKLAACSAPPAAHRHRGLLGCTPLILQSLPRGQLPAGQARLRLT